MKRELLRELARYEGGNIDIVVVPKEDGDTLKRASIALKKAGIWFTLIHGDLYVSRHELEGY